jgi:glyoxylase-like metal-dependent hydrolase (beta-lactamase superfamily II)
MSVPTSKPQAKQEIERRSLKVGPYTIKAVPTGIFGLDGGAMFGTVPKVLWEKSNPPDDHNRIRMEARALLMDCPASAGKPARRILVDCGIGGDFVEKYGEKLGPKFAEMYAIQGSGIEDRLKSMGLGLGDVTDVILTHLHFDHAGGATCTRGGNLVPTFPNARYYIQKANLETASHPNLRERASYYAANFQPLLDAGVLNVLDGPVNDLLPGVSVKISNGHTLGQQTVWVEDGVNGVVYCGDVIPTSSHVRLPWVMGYDLQPLVLIEEKRELLKPAAQKKYHLFFEHDPDVDCALVDAAKDDFAVSHRYILN